MNLKIDGVRKDRTMVSLVYGGIVIYIDNRIKDMWFKWDPKRKSYKCNEKTLDILRNKLKDWRQNDKSK